GRVGVSVGDDVVDVVQATFCGLVLEPAQDELADPRATPGRVDQEGDLRVAPFAVEPAIADNGAVVISDPPPLVCNERAGRRLIVSHRGQLVRAEQPLLVDVPPRCVFFRPVQCHHVSFGTRPSLLIRSGCPTRSSRTATTAPASGNGPGRILSGQPAWRPGGQPAAPAISVLDADQEGCAGIARGAAGEQSDTAAALAQLLDQLGDGAQPGGALRVAEDQAAAVGVHPR